jgi:D-aspartate ligase
LTAAARKLGHGAVLLAGSDEWAVFVARHSAALAPLFTFPPQRVGLVESLASKQGMYELAREFGLPTPRIARPANLHEVAHLADELNYPVMLKPIVSRPGRQFVAIASSRDSLLEQFRSLEQPDNVLCQEYIPGSDSDVWIFNGYFDARSRCLAAFTGRKLRQHPAHMGLCALGECVHNQEVIALTEEFLGKVGYTGIVDIGYRWDRRDGTYKVLDINPRLGGAFRLFVDRQGMDVARACYLDLTGQPVPPVVPHDGRRWVLEAADLIAKKHYRRDEGLGWLDWLRAYRGVEEGATFSLGDPLPFALAMKTLAADTLSARWERIAARAPRSKASGIAAAGGAERSGL